ncbi:MAG: hypothetical protein WCI25_03230 [Actinomycetes bacterium]|jgi:hypothetical protein
MKYLPLLLLLLLSACDSTQAAAAPDPTPITARLSTPVVTPVITPVITGAVSYRDQGLIPESIPTEVLDLLFRGFFSERSNGATCQSGSARLQLVGLEVKALQRTHLALQVHSHKCALDSIDLFNFSESHGRWLMTTATSPAVIP